MTILKQSSSKNLRSKGFKVKHFLQICLLLAICIWLLQQVRKSYDRKKAYEEGTATQSEVKSEHEGFKLGRKDVRLPVQQVTLEGERQEVDETKKAKPEPEAMAPPTVIRWYAITSAIVLLLLISPSLAIYCDEDDCYDLLGVSQNANSSEIKKAYYKLSLKYHPDKNPDPDSRKLFVKIANAYEILKDEATREQYDYAIAHPEEVFYNAARYYHAYYGHKTDPRAVLVGLLLIFSGFQYLNQWTRYNQAVAMVKKTPAYRNKLRALELERSGGIPNKKKSNRQMDKKTGEDLGKELDLQIKGAEKPSVWELIGVRLILLPYTIGKLLLWWGRWYWRYNVKKASYAWEDASYLTQKSLRVPHDAWMNIDESKKEDLVKRRVWEKSNLESYLAEMRKESKRRR